jgi:hypothetical protein
MPGLLPGTELDLVLATDQSDCRQEVRGELKWRSLAPDELIKISVL